MKYSKQDLMKEGWASMETLLDQEMPTNKKDNNYKLIALFVICAFVVGLYSGTLLPSKGETAELIQKTGKLIPSQELSEVLLPQQIQQLKTNAASTSSDDVSKTIGNSAIVNSIATSPRTSSTTIVSDLAVNPTSTVQENKNTASNQGLNTSIKTSEAITFGKEFRQSMLSIGLLGILPMNDMISNGIGDSYLPRISRKIRSNTKWVLGLGLNTGINVDRNTKVLSLNSDWMYKIGKQNSIGIQFLYAAEDELGFLNINSEVGESNGSTPKKTGEVESESRSADKELIQNSRQYRFASGLVIQQEIGYRFYSNFAFGIDMLQNSYSEDIDLKSYNLSKDIQYHFGGYTSIALGYKLSKLIDLEISGTKSMLIQDSGQYKPGNSDHIVGGVKISF